MIKRFFISNGTDYAMAINDEEIKVFCNYSDACVFRQKRFDYYKDLFESMKTFERDYFTTNFFELTEKDGSRMIFQIIENNLEESTKIL